MADYDILIKGGTIVDGTRTPRYVSDIAIKDGKIAQIGGLKGKTAERVLDAAGRIVAPGFVDLHTHYDAQIFWDPYCTLSGWHGVTSVALGNCGFGFAPSRVEDRDRAMLSMTRNEAIPYDAMKAGMPWNWVTFPDFIDSLTRTPKGVNCLTYVPLTPLYAWVMGWEEAKKRRPTEAELQEMCRLIHEAMDAGACGWSAQVLGANSIQRDYDGTPMITDMLSEHEILTFAKVLADRDEGFIELAYKQTGEEGRPLAPEAKEFFEKVAAVAKRPILYQAVTPNSVHPEQHRARIRWLESCAERGLRVYGQGATRRGGFEMTFEDWNLFDDTEAWREVTLGTKDERKAKMQDPEMRRRLKEEWDSGIRPTQVAQGSVGSLVVLTKNVKIDIGAESAFPTLPAPVEIGSASYFLIKTRDGYRLLSRVCPHQGGTVEDGGAAIRLSQSRVPVRQGRRQVPQRRRPADEILCGQRQGRTADRVGAGREGRQRVAERANRPADRRRAGQARDRRAARHGRRGRFGDRVFRPDPGAGGCPIHHRGPEFQPRRGRGLGWRRPRQIPDCRDLSDGSVDLARPGREDDQFGGCALQIELSAGPFGRLQRPRRDPGAGTGGHRGL